MKILVYWDDEDQANLIDSYLTVDDGNEITLLDDSAAFVEAACSRAAFDVMLMATSPDVDVAFEHFQTVQSARPNCAIVCACLQSDVFRIIRFMTNGLRTYIVRDPNGDFIFMLQAILESSVEAMLAEQERLVAEKMREEIESVRQLQESVIPKDIPVPPGYRICTRYEPSQIRSVGGRAVTMAGGDYYDVFNLDDDNIVLLVGDASGHGMKACMSIMTMHTLIRMIRSNRYRDPGKFVAEINDQLSEQTLVNDEGGFITLLYGVLHVSKRELHWASAGHQPPVLHDLTTGEIGRVGSTEAGGLPLAIASGIEYDTHVTQLPSNSRILFYTDGLEEAFPEASHEAHREFGLEGIIGTLKDSRDSSVDEALAALFDRSHEFTEGAGRHDDTSSILLEWD